MVSRGLIAHNVSGGAWRWFVAAVAVAVCALPAAAARAAPADDLWELTPFRVRLIVACDPVPLLDAGAVSRLERELLERADLHVGPSWRTELVAPGAELRWRMLNGLERLEAADLPAEALELDKLILVAVSFESGTYNIRAREFDGRARQWGAVVTRAPPLGIPPGIEAFRAAVGAFTPLAVVEDYDSVKRTVTLRVRAAALVPRDPSIVFVAPGRVFRPVVRQNDREGLLKGQPSVTPWTYLFTETYERGAAVCQVHSGVRSPIAARRRGRVEHLALGVVPTSGSTRLIVQARMEPKIPLGGYDIYAYGADSRATTLLGRTDDRGAIVVPPGPHPLRLLLVKNGENTLAKLPIIPGVEAEMIAEVPSDDARLEVEGYIVGMQESLVDLIVRREVLLKVARSQIAAAEFDEARSTIAELRKLKTREQFAGEIRRQRQLRGFSSDKQVQSKIDRLFSDTEKLLARIDAGVIDTVDSELRKARQGQATAQAAQ